MTSRSALTPVHRGKIRELFRTDDDRLVMVASDRISAYDHVLSTPIPDKGRILTAMSVWWFERLADVVPNHVLSFDDPVIPAEWRGRALVCRPLTMVPIEAVARGYLAGSGVTEYLAGGAVCGVPLPDGLAEGSRLPEPIFTPATKADVGEHDENIDFAGMVGRVGDETATAVRDATLAVYARAAELAEQRGILLADTKLEFGRDAGGTLTLGDEVLTPDSSRFWPAETWEPGRTQPSYDKQYVRDWLTGPDSGWDRASDTPPPPLPDEVVASTRSRYVQAYEQLTGQRFADWLGG